MMHPVEQKIRAMNKQYITIADLIRAGAFDPDITVQGVYHRMRTLPEGERPEDFGAFNAGGSITFVFDSGIRFALHHMRYWEQKQAEKQAKRRAS